VEEPFGAFASGVSTGHAAIYLQRCVPLLRRSWVSVTLANSGSSSVVIMGWRDAIGWPFLYCRTCTLSLSKFLPSPTALVRSLRDEYRRAHLRNIAADAPGGSMPRVTGPSL